MRRCFLLAILACAFSTSAHAQTGPGTIYYSHGSNTPKDVYRVSGNGTGNMQIGPYPWTLVGSTALTTYPGGRQFLSSSVELGPIPGSTDKYGDITLMSEVGVVATTVTNFRGPQYVSQNGIKARFSNDQWDSFLSFGVYDTRIGHGIYVRYNGPISDIFQPGFIPFVSDDPRLVTVYSSLVGYAVSSWDASGTKLTLTQGDGTGKTLIYIYDTMTNSLNLVNNPSASGFNLTGPWCSSTEFRLFSPATHSNGTKGMVSFYPATGQFSWVIKEGGNGSNYIDGFSAAAISPDGTTLAFGMRRMVGKYLRPSLVRIPVAGGTYTPLVTFTDSYPNVNSVGGLWWRW